MLIGLSTNHPGRLFSFYKGFSSTPQRCPSFMRWCSISKTNVTCLKKNKNVILGLTHRLQKNLIENLKSLNFQGKRKMLVKFIGLW